MAWTFQFYSLFKVQVFTVKIKESREKWTIHSPQIAKKISQSKNLKRIDKKLLRLTLLIEYYYEEYRILFRGNKIQFRSQQVWYNY